jgi:ribosome maturation protein SDO1
MVSLEEAVIARLKKEGMEFEILVDPYKAMEVKEGKEVSMDELVAVEEIFSDSKKGDRASKEGLLKAFNTDDFETVVKTIILEGDIQITAQQRREMQEAKKKQIVYFIHRNAINPQTNTPHPPERIERALEEAKVHIDVFKSVDEQIPGIIKVLRPIIPLKFEEIEVAIKIPPLYAPKAYGELHSFGNMVRDEWQNDGSWICIIKIPAGMQDELYDMVNRISRGEAQTKIIKRLS